MSRFIDRGRLPVQLEGDPDVIYIRPEVSVSMQNKLADVRVERDAAGNVLTGNGAATNALLEVFIIGWSGPGFEGQECTPVAIGELKGDDPLVKKVLEEIKVRVAPLGKRTPSSPTAGAQS